MKQLLISLLMKNPKKLNLFISLDLDYLIEILMELDPVHEQKTYEIT
jgi:hypothetical protein